MHCKKCGKKIRGGHKYCLSCGAKIEGKKNLFGKYWFVLAFLGIIGILGFIFYPKVKEILPFKKKPGDLPQFKALKDLETKHWEESLKKAKEWDGEAKLDYVYASIDYWDQEHAWTSYTFFSENKKGMAFEIFWTKKGEMKTEEEKKSLYSFKEIPQFPSRLSVEGAVMAAIKEFDIRQGRKKRKVVGFSLYLSQAANDWKVTLKVNEGENEDCKSECEVSFIKKAICEKINCYVKKEEEKKPAYLDSGQFEAELLKLSGLEEKYLADAKNRALSWSEQAQLCNFRIGLREMDSFNPEVSYYFCVPEGSSNFIVRYPYDSEEVKESEWENEYIYDKPLDEFPPPLLAGEAVELVTIAFRYHWSSWMEIEDFSLSVSGTIGNWMSFLKIKGDRGKTLNPICRVYFDRRVECSL